MIMTHCTKKQSICAPLSIPLYENMSYSASQSEPHSGDADRPAASKDHI